MSEQAKKNTLFSQFFIIFCYFHDFCLDGKNIFYNFAPYIHIQ